MTTEELLLRRLKKTYASTCNKYVKLFCDKQDMYFEYWIAGFIGETAAFGDIFLQMREIIYDLESNQPKGKIVEWYWHCIENQDNMVNYYAYTKMNTAPATEAEFKESKTKRE
jgi:hypothetical protein